MPSTAFPSAVAPHFTELAERWRDIPDTYASNARAMLALIEFARDIGGGRPLIVTSWYRSPARNVAVGGADSSQHLTASAMDVSVNDPRDWFLRVGARLPSSSYGQMIYYAATSQHIHLSLPNRTSGITGEMLIETSPKTFRRIDGTPVNGTPPDSAEGVTRKAINWAIIGVIAVGLLLLLGVI